MSDDLINKNEPLIQNKQNTQNNLSVNLSNNMEVNSESLLKQENNLELQKLFNVEVGSDVTGIGKVANLVERVLSPKILRKSADSFEYAVNKVSEVIKNQELPENISLRIGDIEIKSIPSSIDERALHSLIEKEVKSQKNIEDIVSECLRQIDYSKLTSTKEVDEDWFDTFCDSARYISSKELKSIWAKLLANEIQSPSSYSLRTVNTLKNMSKEEAEIFKKFINVTVKELSQSVRLTTKNSDILNNQDITYQDILLLEEIGLVQTGANINILKGNNVFFMNSSKAINIINDSNDKDISVYRTSIVGTELANIVTELDDSINEGFIEEFIEELKKNNGFAIQILENCKIDGKRYTADRAIDK